MAGPGAQHLLGRPQGVAPARRTHHRKIREVHACRGERGRIRQVRRRQPCDALARRGQGSQRRQRELQLADSFLQAEDLGERADRPAAARQFPVELGVTRGNRFGNPGERGAAPNRMPLQDVLEGDHGVTVFLYSIGGRGKGYDEFQEEAAMADFTLRVNGNAQSVSVESDTPLLYVLRNDVGLNGPKFGCGLAQCGACTVLIDGKPVRSCVTPVSAVKGAITTIEGIGSLEKLHPLQKAFIEEQACQCGYCGNGMVMSAKALLERNPRPTNDEVRQALNGHLCRCASHNRIVRAVQRAAKEMQS